MFKHLTMKQVILFIFILSILIIIGIQKLPSSKANINLPKEMVVTKVYLVNEISEKGLSREIIIKGKEESKQFVTALKRAKITTENLALDKESKDHYLFNLDTEDGKIYNWGIWINESTERAVFNLGGDYYYMTTDDTLWLKSILEC